MQDWVRRHRRDVLLLVVGAVIATMLITPVGAHVGGTVGHLWNQHIKPKATNLFYTKKQSNQRFVQKTLPVGQTQRGTWSMGGDGSSYDMWNAISFPTPLAHAPVSHWLAQDAAPTADCPGTPANPQAAPGHLCVYTRFQSGTTPGGIYAGSNLDSGTSDRFGAVMWTQPTVDDGDAYAWGTWAVKAGSASTSSLSTDGGDGRGPGN